MNIMKNKSALRWAYLAMGVFTMLFAGVLYAWSILKAPLAAEFGWGASGLALNFTLAMSFFCIGGLLGAQISKRKGHRMALILAGILSAAGFLLTAALGGNSVWMLYITYGILAGMGIGIVYNVVILMGLKTDYLKMLSALIVALFLGVPYLKATYFTKHKDLHPSDLMNPQAGGGDNA